MAGNVKDSRILEYKDLISQLNTTIAAQTELIKSLQQTLEADRAEKKVLEEKIDYLTKKLLAHPAKKSKMSVDRSTCSMKQNKRLIKIRKYLLSLFQNTNVKQKYTSGTVQRSSFQR